MTIRLQNLLAIPPIFLVLGVVTGTMAYRAAYSEVLWGLEEEAISLAVTVAEMIDREVFDGSADALDAASRSLERLVVPGRAASVIVYSSGGGGEPLLARHVDEGSRLLEGTFWELYGEDVQRSLAATASGVMEWGPYPRALVAGAPILGSQRASLGVVGVVIDARRMDTLLQGIRRDFFMATLLVTGLGVVAALFLSASFGRQVSALGRVAASIAAGDYRTRVQVRGVKEVEDLFNTLRTMASILQDVLSRGRRALVVGDPFQVSHGVALGYRSVRRQELPDHAGVEVGVAHSGPVEPGHFYGSVDTGDRIVFWVGAMGAGTELDVAIQSAAADRFLGNRLRAHQPDKVLDEACKVFSLDSLQMGWVEAGSEPTIQARSKVGSGSPIVGSDMLALHSFEDDRMTSLTSALALFAGVSAERIGNELSTALPVDASGVVLIVHVTDLNAQGGSAS